MFEGGYRRVVTEKLNCLLTAVEGVALCESQAPKLDTQRLLRRDKSTNTNAKHDLQRRGFDIGLGLMRVV